MNAERLLVWAAALAATAVFLLADGATAEIEGRLLLTTLGVVVAVPLATVFLGWLSAVRGGERGWS